MKPATQREIRYLTTEELIRLGRLPWRFVRR